MRVSAPATEDLRELERLLVVAAETGESREFGTLREELAMGHDDLTQALNVLREHGKAHEESPGCWTGGSDDAGGPVVVSVPDPAEPHEENGGAAALERFDRARGEPRPFTSESAAVAGATIRLTVAVANALDAESLGKLVKAGISEAVEQELPFTMEVL